jgi:hypothetical protein
MRTRTEADSAFLNLVQDTLQASAKEAERITALTGTRLVRIYSVQPAAPKEFLSLLAMQNSPIHGDKCEKN